MKCYDSTCAADIEEEEESALAANRSACQKLQYQQVQANILEQNKEEGILTANNT